MAKTVTKSDYKDGMRGYYTLITSKETTGKGWHNLNNKIAAKIRLILSSMEGDGYTPYKFYVQLLRSLDWRVYGVGEKILEESLDENRGTL